MTNIWDQDTHTGNDSGLDTVVRTRWLRDHPTGEFVTFERQYTTRRGLLAMADVAASCLTSPRMTSAIPTLLYIESDEALVAVGKAGSSRFYEEYIDDLNDYDAEPDLFRPSNLTRCITLVVTVTADRSLVGRVFAAIETAFKKEKEPKVRWWFKGDRGSVAYKDISMPPVTTLLHSTFYPDIEDGPNKYLADYLKSDASVLLLAGPPGTGKTTLLRHLISDFNLSAHVIYDEDLMNTDKVFQTFLFENDSDLMVIEDADITLQSRNDGNNKMMARFLSVSDGLIKLPNKKLVFTTNLTDFSRVDGALLRPGRCFGLAHTRALNHGEAIAAATAANLIPPERRGEYTLAELFNNCMTPEVRRVGFV